MSVTLKEIVRDFYKSLQFTEMSEKQYQMQQKNFIEILRAFGIDPVWLKINGIYSIPCEYKSFIIEVLSSFSLPWVKKLRKGEIYHIKDNSYSLDLTQAYGWYKKFLDIVRQTSKDPVEFQDRVNESKSNSSIALFSELGMAYYNVEKAALDVANLTKDRFDINFGVEEEIVLINYTIGELTNLRYKINAIQTEMSLLCIDEFLKDVEHTFSQIDERSELYSKRIQAVKDSLKYNSEFRCIEQELNLLIKNGKYLGSPRVKTLEELQEKYMQSAELALFGSVEKPPSLKPDRNRLSSEDILRISIEKYSNKSRTKE